MSNEAVQIDSALIAELDSALDALDAHLAKIPQGADLRLLTLIDLLHRTRRLIQTVDEPLSQRYGIIAANIPGFFSRRPDGLPSLILPPEIESKLRVLMEKAQALSAQ